MSERINLDELEELNPAIREFVLKGQVLYLGELAHQKYFEVSERFEQLQEKLGQAEFKVKDLERETIAILLELFGPFNAGLEGTFFNDVTERKLSYLTTEAMAHQQAFAKDLEGGDVPNSRAARRAAARKNGARGARAIRS